MFFQPGTLNPIRLSRSTLSFSSKRSRPKGSSQAEPHNLCFYFIAGDFVY